MSRVIHFEIQASDPDALIAFYSDLFGWKFERWGDHPYWLIETGASDQPGINGGLLPRRGAPPVPMQSVNCFVCTVEVASLDDSLARATSLGAEIVVPKRAIEGVGWLAYIKDPDGNILGLMQPDESAV